MRSSPKMRNIQRINAINRQQKRRNKRNNGWRFSIQYKAEQNMARAWNINWKLRRACFGYFSVGFSDN